MDFGTADTGVVRFVVNNNCPTAVDARLGDLAVRSSSVKGRSRGWLVPAEVLGLVTTLAGFLLLRLVRNPGRRPDPMPPPAGAAGGKPAAPLVAFPRPQCGRRLGAAEPLAGQKVKCPHCGRAVRVPG